VVVSIVPASTRAVVVVAISPSALISIFVVTRVVSIAAVAARVDKVRAAASHPK
jgi:hypothetical protein